MSVSTVRPDSTVSNGTSTIGGTPSPNTREQAVADDTDSTYVAVSGSWPSTTTNFGFTLPALGSGAQMISAILRAKLTSSPGNSALGISLAAGGDVTSTSVNVGTSTITTTLLGAYGDGSTLEAGFWQVGIGTGTPRLIEVYLDIYYAAKPVVSADSPTGTLTEDNRPTVEWTNTIDDLTEQRGYQVRVFTDAVYGGGGFAPGSSTAVAETLVEESGILFISDGEGTSWQITEPLPNDTYRAYVRIKDGYQWSDWDNTEFTVNVSPPDPPAVTYTDDPANGRVAVQITPDNSPVATDGVVLQKDVEGEWADLGTDTSGGVVTLYDYEVQPGVQQDYRVLAWNDTASARLYTSPVTGNVTPAGQRWWLKHPTDPTLNVELSIGTNPVRSNPGHARARRQSFQHPLGREFPVAIEDTPNSKTGTLTFMVQDFSDHTAVEAILDSGVPLLLSGPFNNHWVDKWVKFGDEDWTRIIDYAYTEPFDVTLSWQEVERP